MGVVLTPVREASHNHTEHMFALSSQREKSRDFWGGHGLERCRPSASPQSRRPGRSADPEEVAELAVPRCGVEPLDPDACVEVADTGVGADDGGELVCGARAAVHAWFAVDAVEAHPAPVGHAIADQARAGARRRRRRIGEQTVGIGVLAVDECRGALGEPREPGAVERVR